MIEVLRHITEETSDIIFDAFKAGIWTISIADTSAPVSAHKIRWTAGFRKMLGYQDAKEFPDTFDAWTNRIHPEDRERVLKALGAHLAGAGDFDIEYRLRIEQGEYRWFRSIGKVFYNKGAQSAHFIGSLFDINDKKQAEIQAAFFITRLELISNALTEGPWDMNVKANDPVNPQNEFWWSPQFRKILGYENELDFPNKLSSWSDSLHPEDQETTLRAFSEHLNDYSGNTPYSLDYRLRLKNGEYRWFHATGTTVRDSQGKPLRVAGTIRDIEHEKRQLMESREKINRYSEIVNAFNYKKWLDDNMVLSPQMKNTVANVEKYAKVDAPVLITGETGVGKEVISDLLHLFSDRKDNPFLKINCGAIPEHLLESELFGYEDGAFSGAKKGGKMGFFELADNGTVLLDEIGDLPLHLQVKILRFVQSQEFYRLGGKKLIKVNTRIIAATNRNLQEMVINNEFRADLFYRLQVLTINIPPLRERPSEIIPFTNHFLQKYNEKYHKNIELSSEVYNLFERYDWKGNVRELENLIERLVVIAETKVVSLNIPAHMKQLPVSEQGTGDNIIPYSEAKEQFERDYLQKALDAYGSTRKVAEKVKLDHSTIVKKAAKYGINLLSWQK